MQEEDVEIGRIALDKGWVTQSNLNECFSESVLSSSIDLATVLQRRGFIDDRQAAEARAEAQKAVLRNKDGKIDEPSDVFPAPGGIPAEVTEAANDPQNCVDKFIRTREIGRGALGSVWKAWDTETMQWRALKFITVTGEDPAALVEKAQVSGRVKHPNLVRVYESGVRSEGPVAIPYLVTDFVDGKSLQELRDVTMTPERAAGLMRDAASAVAAAHEHGVLHLDLTPRNILVDSTGSIHITDFGLAAPVGTFDPEAGTSSSRIIEVKGTPSYMSPEQVLGRSIDITVRSDVYMLGATLFFALAGRAPFEAESPTLTCLKVIREPLPKLTDLVPGMSADLEQIVARAMAKDPVKRYESAKLLAADLDRFLHHAAILSDDELLFTQGVAALNGGRLEEAVHMFKELMRLSGAKLLRQMEEGEEGLTLAIEQQQKNFHVRTQRGITRLAKAVILSLEGDDPKEACKGALDDFVKACELRPTEASARINRANVLTFTGRYARDTGKDVASIFKMALNDLSEAIQLDPTASTAFHNRGIIYFYLAKDARKGGSDPTEMYRKSVDDLSAACNLEPTYPYILKDLGVAKVALAKEKLARKEKVKDLYSEAVDHLTRAVQLNAGLTGAWYERGHALFALKQFDQAIKDWKRTIELDPSRKPKIDPLLQEAQSYLEKRGTGRT